MEIPVQGFGTYNLKAADCDAVLKEAVSVGYRHFDFATYYNNEAAIGPVLTDIFKQHKREDFFFTSKIWPTEMGDIEATLRATLADLHLDYLDLYLVHWPLAFDAAKKPRPLQAVWRDMERMQRLGLVHRIGVSNFTVPLVLDVLSYAEIAPYCNEIEVNVHENKSAAIAFFERLGLRVSAYRVIGSSLGALESDSGVRAAAERRNCSVSQIALKYLHQKNNVVLLAKSATRGRIAENYTATDVEELDAHEMEHFDAMRGSQAKAADGVGAWGFNVFD